MRGAVRKWGNSASVRIPAVVLAAARIGLDEPVDIREEDGRIIIEKLRTGPCDLAALIDGITEENRHDSADFGASRGHEAW